VGGQTRAASPICAYIALLHNFNVHGASWTRGTVRWRESVDKVGWQATKTGFALAEGAHQLELSMLSARLPALDLP
jgi:hypothetical protein